MNHLFVDVVSKDARKLIGRLNRLAGTRAVDRGEYLFPGPTGYSQVLVSTDKTEEELDDWLYSVKHGCEYVGCGETDPFDPADYEEG